jgi:hypothetical protein
MLQNLSREIRECFRRAEECKRLASAALTDVAKADFLDMERRWLSLARSYEFAERLSNFTSTPPSGRKPAKKYRVQSAPPKRASTSRSPTHGYAE